MKTVLLSFAYLSPLPENIPCYPEVSPKTGQILHQICKVLKWGWFRYPAYGQM